MSAYMAFSIFHARSKVTTWLYRIVVKACLMKFRKEKSRAKYLTETGYDDAVAHDWRYDPEKAVTNAELPRLYRARVLLRKYLEVYLDRPIH